MQYAIQVGNPKIELNSGRQGVLQAGRRWLIGLQHTFQRVYNSAHTSLISPLSSSLQRHLLPAPKIVFHASSASFLAPHRSRRLVVAPEPTTTTFCPLYVPSLFGSCAVQLPPHFVCAPTSPPQRRCPCTAPLPLPYESVETPLNQLLCARAATLSLPCGGGVNQQPLILCASVMPLSCGTAATTPRLLLCA